jgi:hypothetical protein
LLKAETKGSGYAKRTCAGVFEIIPPKIEIDPENPENIPNTKRVFPVNFVCGG